MSDHVKTVFSLVDWGLFSEQKEYLVNEMLNNTDVSEIYEGVLNFLDNIVDAAVKDGLIDAEKAYPTET